MSNVVVYALAVMTLLLAVTKPEPGFAKTCDVPVIDWQPREELRVELEAAGWHVRAITIRDGCYAAAVFDDSGYEADVLYDPRTLSEVADEH